MREHRIRAGAHERPVEEKVEIERARRPALGAAAATVTVFNGVEPREEPSGLERGFDFGHGVPVRGLVSAPKGRVPAGTRDTKEAGGGRVIEIRKPAAEMVERLVDVGAKPHVGPGSRRQALPAPGSVGGDVPSARPGTGEARPRPPSRRVMAAAAPFPGLVPEGVPGGLGVVTHPVAQEIERRGKAAAAQIALARAVRIPVEEGLIAQDLLGGLGKAAGDLDEAALAADQDGGGTDVGLVPGEPVAFVKRDGQPTGRRPEERGQKKGRRDRKIGRDPGVGVGQTALDEGQAGPGSLGRDHILGPREENGEQPVTAQARERGGGVSVEKEFVDLLEKTRRGDGAEERPEFLHGRCGFGIDVEAEFGFETDGAEHAHRIFTVTLGRLADEAKTSGTQIREPVHPVAERFVPGVVVKGVDRKVTSVGVVALRPVDVVTEKTALVGDHRTGLTAARGRAERGHLHVVAAEIDVHEPETASDQTGVAEDAPHLFRMRAGGNVEVFRVPPKKEIAERATDHIGGMTAFLETPKNLERLGREGVPAETVVRPGNDPRFALRFGAVPWRGGIQ